MSSPLKGLFKWLRGYQSAPNAGDAGVIPGSGRFPGEKKWQHTLGFLPGKSPGQRTVVGYSPRGRRRLGQDLATKQSHSPLEKHTGFCDSVSEET